MIRYHARWILPITSAPVENGTVVVDGSRIVYAGPRSDAPRGEDRELGDVALLPGLVNAHTHLELTTMRGKLEDLAFHDWIGRLRDSRDWLFSDSIALDAARLGIAEGLSCGTTTFADTSPTGSVARAMTEAAVRGVVYQEVFGPDPERCDAMMQDLQQRVAALRQYESALLRIGVSPHAPYTVSDALYRATASFATSQELPLAAHIAESDGETRLVAHGDGPFADGLRLRHIATPPRAASPIALLASLGVLGASTLLIHCVRVDDEDTQAIVDSGAAVAHCPVSNAKLGHGIAPLMQLLGAGVRVGLGSDSVASNNRMDLLEEGRVAVLMQRARSGSHDALRAGEVLRLLTLRGAEALGLGDRIGSLEPGKEADLAAFRLPQPPAGDDVESALIFSLYDRQAMFVSVAGRVLIAEGRAIGPRS